MKGKASRTARVWASGAGPVVAAALLMIGPAPVARSQEAEARAHAVPHNAPTRTGLTGTAKGSSANVGGIPVPSTGAAGEESAAAPPPVSTTPVQNYYGANPTDAFANTSQGAGPPDTSVEPMGQSRARLSPPGPGGAMPRVNTGTGAPSPLVTTPSGSPAAITNPNNVTAAAGGPPANGTGQPIRASRQATGIAVPQEETGADEANPQESTSALIWICVGTVLLIGSIFGTIRLTQPGGQA